MNHSLAKRGYILLYLGLYISVAIGISFIVTILRIAGLPILVNTLVPLKAIVLIIIPIICAYRFIVIEKRAPRIGENYFITVACFIVVLILMGLKTVIILGAASQDKTIDMQSFTAQTLLNLVILSAVCFFGLFLSYALVGKFSGKVLTNS